MWRLQVRGSRRLYHIAFGYSVDGGPAKCVDFASGETLPPDIKAALTDPEVIKTAFNAAFERICIGVYLGIKGRLDPRQWRCTMVRAARMGLPLSLAQCGEVLKLEDRKMTEGKALIRYFSVPNKQTKQGVTKMIRHKPSDAPEKWATFKAYNIRDVDVEQAILKRSGDWKHQSLTKICTWPTNTLTTVA